MYFINIWENDLLSSAADMGQNQLAILYNYILLPLYIIKHYLIDVRLDIADIKVLMWIV